MMRSLWTAASGMHAQQFNIDTIAHNLSNVNTTGFKKGRADFEDLLYQKDRLAGTPSSLDTQVPTGIQVGHGVKVAATQKMYSQGSLELTGNKLDIALEGEGFFRVQLYDGSIAYTRDGAFKIDSNGQVVTHSGYRLEPELIFPNMFLPESISITQDGKVTCRVGGSDIDIPVGRGIELYRFVNPAGLKNIGENFIKETEASGPAIAGRPGYRGMGRTLQGMVEMSNVKVVEEMVNMIVAQRAYEMNSKAIQTSDSMLGTAASLKR
jgi:flagellar basal-body rod protein FlgG